MARERAGHSKATQGTTSYTATSLTSTTLTSVCAMATAVQATSSSQPPSFIPTGGILFRLPDGGVDELAEKQRVMQLLSSEVKLTVGEGSRLRHKDLRFSFEQVADSPSDSTFVQQVARYSSPLCHDAFERELHGHPNLLETLLLLDSIRNGVNLGFNGSRRQLAKYRNHSSAAQLPEAVDDYYAKEQDAGRVTQWTTSPPFSHMRVQPIGVVPKTDDGRVTGYRIINDYSFGDDSVNAFIHKIFVEYAAFEDIVQMVLAAGPGALLSKFDIKSAFRLLAVRMEDLCLQVVQWKDAYAVDLALVFGGRSSPPIWDRVARALHWILKVNYSIVNLFHVDDYLLVSKAVDGLAHATKLFELALEVCARLRVPISLNKCQTPHTCIVHVGLLWDTAEQTVSITDNRKRKVKAELDRVLSQRKGTAAELLSLHGRLTFVAQVLQPARAMLYWFRHHSLVKALHTPAHVRHRRYIRLRQEELQELQAWKEVLSTWPGKWLFASSSWEAGSYQVVHSDACEVGAGGYSNAGGWFSEKHTSQLLEQAQRNKTLSMPYLELHSAVLAVKSLVHPESKSATRVRLFCDCEPVVHAINGGGCHVSGMSSLLFDLALWCVRNNVYLVAEHLSSEANYLADHLSRLRVDMFLQQCRFPSPLRINPRG